MNTLTELLYNPPGIVWPVALMLVAFVALRQVKEQINPIITSLVSGLAQQAQQNSVACGVALCFGLSASLSMWYDVFSQVDATTAKGMTVWQWSGLFAKCANPFIVAFLATFMKTSPSKPPQP